MIYWWVNQNQTYRQEREGGYLWSPKQNSNGARNPHYDNMLRVAPGDLVFSFRDRAMPSLGIVKSIAYSAAKPAEFGTAGRNWDDGGWKVEIEYHDLTNQVRPVDHMQVIRPTLPAERAPLYENGDGKQAYLFRVPEDMAEVLFSLIGRDASTVKAKAENLHVGDSADSTAGAREIEERIEADPYIPETEKESLIKARRGQGKFRDNVSRFERKCRVTGIENPDYLIASHMKPWSQSSNAGRLDGANGLLLSPHVDHLFDNGYISFSNTGDLICSSSVDAAVLRCLHIDPEMNVGPFQAEQIPYLTYHREFRLRK